ncbi:sigma-70 family RNA polymerase sigma factor [Vibrio parahaemolyticus]|uniref:sigma-70 family RNA polymerase sigma factor n=1 Tax=Vibrio parahaemolyticus TaxID=670 RepID=UPI001DC330EB|nr:sigma-70 family RNA polymerase sigma factor [Vibrio parahaemolyticus]EGR1557097.1 sigma-70 family RNA polymerase sigma factor [Vibrio parahaemolyticus]
MEKQKRYETLMKERYQDIYRLAYWLCKDQHIAEDLAQETFLKAWRFFDNLNDPNAEKSWLITILRRENARRFDRKQFDFVDIDECAIQTKTYPGSDRDMAQDWLQKQMMILKPKYREPLLLSLVAGLNHDEIAQALRLNHNTVATRLFRARNQLIAQQGNH